MRAQSGTSQSIGESVGVVLGEDVGIVLSVGETLGAMGPITGKRSKGDHSALPS